MLDNDNREFFVEKEAGALNPTAGFTIERAIYKTVGDLRHQLNEPELRMLAGQLNTSLAKFQEFALRVYAVRKELYRQYNERSIAERTTSIFSPQFNMSVKGHNSKIKEDVDRAFAHAATCDISGQTADAVKWLMSMGIRHSILFSPTMIKIVHDHSPEGSIELARIRQFRSTLFRCIVPLAAAIARAQAVPLKASGTTLDFPDLLQEAFIAAMQTIELYKPIAGGKTLTSYIFTTVNGVISQRKAELGRNVFIPRVVTDKFSYVQKAAEDLMIKLAMDISHDDLEAVAVRATEIAPVSKGSFTGNDVFDLIQATQSEYSMNLETQDEDGFPVEFGDLIESQTDLDAECDKKLAGGRLMKLIKPFTNPTEYRLMEIRWGEGDVKTYADTAGLYYEEFNLPMNKTVVANLEKGLFYRIRLASTMDPSLRAKFSQILASFDLG